MMLLAFGLKIWLRKMLPASSETSRYTGQPTGAVTAPNTTTPITMRATETRRPGVVTGGPRSRRSWPSATPATAHPPRWCFGPPGLATGRPRSAPRRGALAPRRDRDSPWVCGSCIARTPILRARPRQAGGHGARWRTNSSGSIGFHVSEISAARPSRCARNRSTTRGALHTPASSRSWHSDKVAGACPCDPVLGSDQ